jgi:hypothetical protein
LSFFINLKVYLFLLFSSINLFGDEIIPHAFKIKNIGSNKIQLLEKRGDKLCEVNKNALKKSGYKNSFDETVWIEFDRKNHTNCRLISLVEYRSFKDNFREKFR